MRDITVTLIHPAVYAAMLRDLESSPVPASVGDVTEMNDRYILQATAEPHSRILKCMGLALNAPSKRLSLKRKES